MPGTYTISANITRESLSSTVDDDNVELAPKSEQGRHRQIPRGRVRRQGESVPKENPCPSCAVVYEKQLVPRGTGWGKGKYVSARPVAARGLPG